MLSPGRTQKQRPRGAADPVHAVARSGALFALAAAAGLLLAHVVGAFVLDGRIEMIDAAMEGNAPTWASSAAAAAAAAAAALLAIVAPNYRWSGVSAAAALAFLSLDESVEIHERLGDVVGRDLLGASEDLAGSLQLVFLLPVLLILFVVIVRIGWRERSRLRATSALLLGGLMVLAMSVGTEQVLGRLTNHIEEQGTDWPDVIRVGLEEAAELGGWLLLAAGLFALVCDRVRGAATGTPDA